MYLQTRGIFLYTDGDKEMRHMPENMWVHETSLNGGQYHKGHWQSTLQKQEEYTEEEIDKVKFYNIGMLPLVARGMIEHLEHATRGPFLTSPLRANLTPGAKLSPRGVFRHLSVKFSVRPSILLNSREYSPWGWTKGRTFPLGD
jgi:hypothetical protein